VALAGMTSTFSTANCTYDALREARLASIL